MFTRYSLSTDISLMIHFCLHIRGVWLLVLLAGGVFPRAPHKPSARRAWIITLPCLNVEPNPGHKGWRATELSVPDTGVRAPWIGSNWQEPWASVVLGPYIFIPLPSHTTACLCGCEILERMQGRSWSAICLSPSVVFSGIIRTLPL